MSRGRKRQATPTAPVPTAPSPVAVVGASTSASPTITQDRIEKCFAAIKGSEVTLSRVSSDVMAGTLKAFIKDVLEKKDADGVTTPDDALVRAIFNKIKEQLKTIASRVTDIIPTDQSIINNYNKEEGVKRNITTTITRQISETKQAEAAASSMTSAAGKGKKAGAAAAVAAVAASGAVAATTTASGAAAATAAAAGESTGKDVSSSSSSSSSV